MKYSTLILIVILTVTLIGCVSTAPTSESEDSLKEITLDDGVDILNISFLLPSRFEHLDAASEDMSREDLGFREDESSEVQLYLSEEPFQMIYCLLAIEKGRIQQAAFDSEIEDMPMMEALIREHIIAGAVAEGLELTVPNIDLTYPNIGDSAILGEGYMVSYGYPYGFDTLWFRSNSVVVVIYSMYMSADKVSLAPIAKEIEQRLDNYLH